MAAYLTAADLAHIYHVSTALIHTWASRDNWRRSRGRPRRYHVGDAQASYDRIRKRQSMIIWHNEAHRPTAANPGVTTDAPQGLPLEITRPVEERNGNYHIWFAFVPRYPCLRAHRLQDRGPRLPSTGCGNHPARLPRVA
ncbi:MAG TPA: hypothetical protein VIV12_04300 [Streptosporangiaceae bacterium]